ncbi:MAG TPA: type II toxin-antitoxin system PemK/MazF family toxin [Rhizomicrobium sp.]|jgi:mRNA interferase MazF|nr:type II toxin-antitoxin system PemK/MazF family toxin [Rhizomicrobium sp.]
MLLCDPGDIAIVPFPFTDIAVAKPRPALALSGRKANEDSGNTVFAMITTAARSHWTQDIPLSDHLSAGLTATSIVRIKLFTLDNRLIVRRIGMLSAPDRQAVRQMLRGLLTI